MSPYLASKEFLPVPAAESTDGLMVDQGAAFLLTWLKRCYSYVFKTSKPLISPFPRTNPGAGDLFWNNKIFDRSYIEVITWLEISNTGRKRERVIAKG
jgi:hypothetical protein